ncbi:MAG: TlpA family protein disulfide reductase [Muribaculaceae bacterium]|nr:TlpA family protein disulfide reductase [Muribaculaceae bacterium]
MNFIKHFCAILLIVLLQSCVTEDEPSGAAIKSGDTCPYFDITLNDGTLVSTEDLRGHISIIAFFNTSCRDCQMELPELQKVYDYIRVNNPEVKLICISREETAYSIERYWKENSLTLPYSAQPDRTIYNKFASTGIPRVYLVSSQLVITDVWTDNPMATANGIINALTNYFPNNSE